MPVVIVAVVVSYVVSIWIAPAAKPQESPPSPPAPAAAAAASGG
jgi:hypothetical protein